MAASWRLNANDFQMPERPKDRPPFVNRVFLRGQVVLRFVPVTLTSAAFLLLSSAGVTGWSEKSRKRWRFSPPCLAGNGASGGGGTPVALLQRSHDAAMEDGAGSERDLARLGELVGVCSFKERDLDHAAKITPQCLLRHAIFSGSGVSGGSGTGVRRCRCSSRRIFRKFRGFIISVWSKQC